MYTETELLERAQIERADFEKLYANWPYTPYPVQTQERTVDLIPEGGTRLLISRPPDAPKGKRLPVFISLHGGGYIRGRADYDERFCHRTVSELSCMTVNVDYKLAPEHRFPVAPEECYAVLQWVLGGGLGGADTEHVGIGGHSAGGNLAAVACLLAKTRGGRMPACQLIDYGPMSLAGPGPFAGFGKDLYLAPEQRAAYFNTSYLNRPEELEDPRVSPLCAKDVSALPPALIITAGSDPLREGAARYAERLGTAGGDVHYVCFANCNHGFTVMPGLGPERDTEDAWTLMHAFLREYLCE